ncbi:hypothetical protein ACFLXO_08725 [Chloroflexota bacterium]
MRQIAKRVQLGGEICQEEIEPARWEVAEQAGGEVEVEAEVVVAGWEAIGLGPAPAGNASVRIAESVYPIK